MSESHYYDTTYPDKGVTVNTGVMCDECNARMFKVGERDDFHRIQNFQCPACDNTVAVKTPVSGDVL